MPQRRSHVDVVAEILRIAIKGVRKTRIVYGANLNFELLNRYLEKLERADLIVRDTEGTGIIKTTERGKKFLQYYRGLQGFWDYRP